jgi:hypothetical protein
MKQLLRLIATALVLILFSVSPAQALFGSECKKPKSTYSKYLTEHRKKVSAEKTAETKFVSQRERNYQECLKYPKAFLQSRNWKELSQDKAGCGLWKMFYARAESPQTMGRSSVEAYADAMLIVTSYKKCFDPSVYIEAVKWLKANPK